VRVSRFPAEGRLTSSEAWKRDPVAKGTGMDPMPANKGAKPDAWGAYCPNHTVPIALGWLGLAWDTHA
jgi:hypothetical protein